MFYLKHKSRVEMPCWTLKTHPSTSGCASELWRLYLSLLCSNLCDLLHDEGCSY